VDGVCLYGGPLTGIDSVSCRLDQIKALLASAPPTAIASPALRRRLLAKLTAVDHLLQAGRAGGRRGRKALHRADHGLRAFAGAITSAARHGRLEVGFSTSVMGLATDAKAALDPLLVQHP
jgi:hypothetical protein